MSRIGISLLTALFLCVFSQPLFSATSEFLNVQVKQAQLRSTSFFGGSVKAVLAYEDKVELIEDRGEEAGFAKTHPAPQERIDEILRRTGCKYAQVNTPKERQARFMKAVGKI